HFFIIRGELSHCATPLPRRLRKADAWRPVRPVSLGPQAPHPAKSLTGQGFPRKSSDRKARAQSPRPAGAGSKRRTARRLKRELLSAGPAVLEHVFPEQATRRTYHRQNAN